MNYIVFDGTSHFICDESDLTDDLEIIHKIHNMEEADKIVDGLNAKYCGC